MRDQNQIAVVIVGGRRLEMHWGFMRRIEGATTLFGRIGDAHLQPGRWQGNQPPTNKAFVTLTDDEIAIIEEVDGLKSRLLPLQPIIDGNIDNQGPPFSNGASIGDAATSASAWVARPTIAWSGGGQRRDKWTDLLASVDDVAL